MSEICFYNGKVISVDESNNVYSAVCIDGEKISFVGSDEAAKMHSKNAQQIDLRGKAVLPAFIDSHSHMVAVAQKLMFIDLGETSSIDHILAEIRANKNSDDNWLIGMGFDHSKFPNAEVPTKYDLDKVSFSTPIIIMHASGHMAVANSMALKLLGYFGDNYEIPSGGVVRTVGNTNEPNGILEENAFLSKEKKACIKTPSAENIMENIVKAQKLYASMGIATCQDASVDPSVNALLNACADSHSLFIDVIGYAIVPFTFDLMNGKSTTTAEYHNRYKLLGGKTWLDGSPQTQTAWLTKPYFKPGDGKSDNYCGYGTVKDDVLLSYLKKCLENNIQVNAHCNGDAAADQFIDFYQKAIEITKTKTDLRPVMVHAQTVREDQLDKMKKLNMLPTFFLDHVWYWGDLHLNVTFGEERAKRISPLKSALIRNLNFTLHQDCPVVSPNMLLSLHNAVNRKTQSGTVLGEEQRLTISEAIRAITINAAYQIFEENIKGSIEVGKLSDLVILDKSPLEVPVDKIKNIKVIQTIKNGNVIFTNSQS